MSAPKIAPRVLAAYTLPTVCPGSSPGRARAATASGKLAPQRIVGGRMAHRQRTISSWKVYQGLSVSSGLMGQYGSEVEMIHAVHAIPSVSSTCDQASARRGRTERSSMEPMPLPSSEPDQEDRQNDREDIDRQAEQHAEQAGPHHLGAERGGAGESDGDIDGPARDSVIDCSHRERGRIAASVPFPERSLRQACGRPGRSWPARRPR